MKQTFKFIIFILALLVYVSILACGGSNDDGSSGAAVCPPDTSPPVTYSTDLDLPGDWKHVVKGSTAYGNVTLDAGGNVIDGQYTDIDDVPGVYDITGGAFAIGSDGSVTGSYTQDGLIPHSIEQGGGQMSRDKGIMATAGIRSTPATASSGIALGPSPTINDEIGLFIKPGTGYSQNDLEGQWSYGNQNEYGTFTVSGTGNPNVSVSQYFAGGGGPFANIGQLLIDGTGMISGYINNYDVATAGGWMSPDRNVIFLALTPGNAYFAVRMNANFGPCDVLTTTFQLVSFGDDTPVGYGSFTADASGSSVTGVLRRLGPPDENYASGTVDINADGSIEPGTITTTNAVGDHIYNILWGQVNASKNFAFAVATVSGPTNNGSEVSLLIVK